MYHLHGWGIQRSEKGPGSLDLELWMDGCWEWKPGNLQKHINSEDSLMDFKHHRSNGLSKPATEYSIQLSSVHFSKIDHIIGHRSHLNKYRKK